MCPDVLPASLLSRDGRYTYFVFDTIPILLKVIIVGTDTDINTDTFNGQYH